MQSYRSVVQCMFLWTLLTHSSLQTHYGKDFVVAFTPFTIHDSEVTHPPPLKIVLCAWDASNEGNTHVKVYRPKAGSKWRGLEFLRKTTIDLEQKYAPEKKGYGETFHLVAEKDIIVYVMQIHEQSLSMMMQLPTSAWDTDLKYIVVSDDSGSAVVAVSAEDGNKIRFTLKWNDIPDTVPVKWEDNYHQTFDGHNPISLDRSQSFVMDGCGYPKPYALTGSIVQGDKKFAVIAGTCGYPPEEQGLKADRTSEMIFSTEQYGFQYVTFPMYDYTGGHKVFLYHWSSGDNGYKYTTTKKQFLDLSLKSKSGTKILIKEGYAYFESTKKLAVTLVAWATYYGRRNRGPSSAMSVPYGSWLSKYVFSPPSVGTITFDVTALCFVPKDTKLLMNMRAIKRTDRLTQYGPLDAVDVSMRSDSYNEFKTRPEGKFVCYAIGIPSSLTKRQGTYMTFMGLQAGKIYQKSWEGGCWSCDASKPPRSLRRTTPKPGSILLPTDRPGAGRPGKPKDPSRPGTGPGPGGKPSKEEPARDDNDPLGQETPLFNLNTTGNSNSTSSSDDEDSGLSDLTIGLIVVGVLLAVSALSFFLLRKCSSPEEEKKGTRDKKAPEADNSVSWSGSNLSPSGTTATSATASSIATELTDSSV